MKGRWPPIWTLLRLSLVLERRAGGAAHGGGARAPRAFGLTLVLFFGCGAVLAAGAAADLPLFWRMTTYLGLAGACSALAILGELQSLWFAPVDVDVLCWRPIAARTWFAARLLHLGVHTGLLTMAFLVVPSLEVAASVAARRVVVWFGFGGAAILHASTVACGVALVGAALLRTVSGPRQQDTLIGAQIGMAAVVLVAYREFESLLVHADLGSTPVPGWMHLLPAAWLAHLPAALSGTSPDAEPLVFVAGLAVLVGAALLAGWLLAPSDAMELVDAPSIEGVRCAAAVMPGGSATKRFGDALCARAAAMLRVDPLRRAGFEFLLAHLRGDRSLQRSLVPVVVVPVVYVAYGLLAGRGWDPYSTESQPTTFADERAAVALFMGSYFFVVLAIHTLRSLASSSGWRASWVFCVAPMQRFDVFHDGVLCGALYGLLAAPAVIVLVILVVAWQNPAHAMAHLALPLGCSALAAVVLRAVDPALPLAREPLRYERSLHWMAGLVMLAPLGLVARAHFHLRGQPFVLLFAALAPCVMTAVCARLARHRLQKLPRSCPGAD